MDQSRINRINELARKAKSTQLSQEEKEEQRILREEYVKCFKANLVSTLENTYIVDEKGNKRKVKKKE
ncbi:MAG TPA: DUF896 domain-containing protein [Clostridia bacterium]|nr:DUF896 domain-containing protein [Clostridia bacterium]